MAATRVAVARMQAAQIMTRGCATLRAGVHNTLVPVCDGGQHQGVLH